MNPGTLRHYFALEAPQETPDGSGGVTRSFVTVTRLWGMMHPIKRSRAPEVIGDERTFQRNSYLVDMRYLSVISAGHRLRLGDRLFDIQSVVDPDGLRDQLHLIVEEVKP